MGAAPGWSAEVRGCCLHVRRCLTSRVVRKGSRPVDAAVSRGEWGAVCLDFPLIKRSGGLLPRYRSFAGIVGERGLGQPWGVHNNSCGGDRPDSRTEDAWASRRGRRGWAHLTRMEDAHAPEKSFIRCTEGHVRWSVLGCILPPAGPVSLHRTLWGLAGGPDTGGRGHAGRVQEGAAGMADLGILLDKGCCLLEMRADGTAGCRQAGAATFRAGSRSPPVPPCERSRVAGSAARWASPRSAASAPWSRARWAAACRPSGTCTLGRGCRAAHPHLLCDGREGQFHVEAGLGAGLHERQPVLLQAHTAGPVVSWQVANPGPYCAASP